MRRSLAVRGPAPPRVVWRRYARLALWPTWSPQIRSVSADGGRLATGRRGTVHGWAGLRVPFVVDEVSRRRRRWVWTVHLAGVLGLPLPGWARSATRMRLEHAVAPRSGRGSTTTLVVSGRAPVVAAYAPLAAWALRRLVR